MRSEGPPVAPLVQHPLPHLPWGPHHPPRRSDKPKMPRPPPLPPALPLAGPRVQVSGSFPPEELPPVAGPAASGRPFWFNPFGLEKSLQPKEPAASPARGNGPGP